MNEIKGQKKERMYVFEHLQEIPRDGNVKYEKWGQLEQLELSWMWIGGQLMRGLGDPGRHLGFIHRARPSPKGLRQGGDAVRFLL